MAKKAPPPPPRREEEGASSPPPLPPPPLSSFPSPSSSSSSSDFEFTISLSPTSRSTTSAQFCPADDLFYKGQLLPLHLSPRLSMVRTLLLSSSSASSSSTATSASRDSSGSSADSTSSFSGDLLLLSTPDCDSSRPSSATADDDPHAVTPKPPRPRPKYLSSLATKFSSVFHRQKKEQPPPATTTTPSHNTGVKDVIKKCVRKVKPLYEKIHTHNKRTFSFSIRRDTTTTSTKQTPASPPTKPDPDLATTISKTEIYNKSFSGNLRHPRRNRSSMAASCPSSIRSSPSHSGLLLTPTSTASMDELQSAIQGAIAHCKSTLKKDAPPVSG